MLVSSLVLALLAGLGPQVAVRALAAGRVHDAVGDVPSADVVLVLGAGVEPSGEPSPFLRARLQLAAELYETGRAKVVLVSGDNRESNYNEPRAMKRWLVANGVPEGRIVEDPGGLDTHASCLRAKRVYGVDRLTVVTQSYHLPRAVATCRMVGLDVQGLGDSTVKTYRSTWDYGVSREWAANLKLPYDLVSGDELGAPSSAVRDALAGG
ncbi:SanA/YdcF family protein [Aestuariimicrobium ganziense]|uniref:SanA/YdcF family protein n=1 Tax=Aestuariimicrobium ganziense TaxID=2773677 RepID=UPI001940FCF6|nr:ElyC/SanA/YdcF family protein [Aestuariimicrobium ganziense]